MVRFAQDNFIPKNLAKYIGANNKNIKYRSSWELSVMMFLDNTPSILGWSSESISIPYRNPFTGKHSNYIPDFLVIYMDKNGTKHCEMWEVKPEKEMPSYQGKVAPRTKLVQAINAAKWQAAMSYCAKRSWSFRVINEKQLFAFKRK